MDAIGALQTGISMTDGEELKSGFDREKVTFEQGCQEFRSLNGFLWHILVVVSRTDGLPHAATTSTSVVMESEKENRPGQRGYEISALKPRSGDQDSRAAGGRMRA